MGRLTGFLTLVSSRKTTTPAPVLRNSEPCLVVRNRHVSQQALMFMWMRTAFLGSKMFGRYSRCFCVVPALRTAPKVDGRPLYPRLSAVLLHGWPLLKAPTVCKRSYNSRTLRPRTSLSVLKTLPNRRKGLLNLQHSQWWVSCQRQTVAV